MKKYIVRLEGERHIPFMYYIRAFSLDEVKESARHMLDLLPYTSAEIINAKSLKIKSKIIRK